MTGEIPSATAWLDFDRAHTTGAPKRVLEVPDIEALAKTGSLPSGGWM